jgi:hypothetical protein
VLASGTPITNTLGEMFTVQRLMDHAALSQRGLHEFDAWASTFGDTTTELELQPSGKYKPVTRFAQFVNVPELIAMFRSFADVVHAGRPAHLCQGAGDHRREAPDHHGRSRRRLQGLSATSRPAHQGDREARGTATAR